METNPEIWQSKRAKEEYLLLAKVAIFDELIDLHHDGYCTFEEAIEQYHADVQQLLDEA